MPKRVKRREGPQRQNEGQGTKGNTITYGDYGLVSTECGWITSNQIEAARIAMTRSVKRGGKVYIKIFLTSRLRRNQLKYEWVPVRVLLSTG